jgi:hypothetical protein
MRKPERREIDPVKLDWSWTSGAFDVTAEDSIKNVLALCRKKPKMMVHKFDSIWVASDPLDSKGGTVPMKRIVMAQSDDPSVFKVLSYYPDHTNDPTDPYIIELHTLLARWMSRMTPPWSNPSVGSILNLPSPSLQIRSANTPHNISFIAW